MKKFMKKLLKKAEGFTLVELIVVIAILGILAGVAVPAYSGYLDKAAEAADVTTLSAIKTAAQASQAKVGAVSKIEVTIALAKNDTAKLVKGDIIQIDVTVPNNDSVTVYSRSTTKDEAPTWGSNDFKMFMNNTAPSALSSKSCTDKAILTWNGSWDIDA